VLVIRADQMQALGAAAREAFEGKVAARLEALFPESCASLGRPGTLALVRRSAARARALGIVEEAPVATFVELCVEFGEAFEASPDGAKAEGILKDARLPGQIKVILVAECLTAATGGRKVAGAISGPSH
jgi:hypothetical protein